MTELTTEQAPSISMVPALIWTALVAIFGFTRALFHRFIDWTAEVISNGLSWTADLLLQGLSWMTSLLLFGFNAFLHVLLSIGCTIVLTSVAALILPCDFLIFVAMQVVGERVDVNASRLWTSFLGITVGMAIYLGHFFWTGSTPPPIVAPLVGPPGTTTPTRTDTGASTTTTTEAAITPILGTPAAGASTGPITVTGSAPPEAVLNAEEIHIRSGGKTATFRRTTPASISTTPDVSTPTVPSPPVHPKSTSHLDRRGPSDRARAISPRAVFSDTIDLTTPPRSSPTSRSASAPAALRTANVAPPLYPQEKKSFDRILTKLKDTRIRGTAYADYSEALNKHAVPNLVEAQNGYQPGTTTSRMQPAADTDVTTCLDRIRDKMKSFNAHGSAQRTLLALHSFVVDNNTTSKFGPSNHKLNTIGSKFSSTQVALYHALNQENYGMTLRQDQLCAEAARRLHLLIESQFQDHRDRLAAKHATHIKKRSHGEMTGADGSC